MVNSAYARALTGRKMGNGFLSTARKSEGLSAYDNYQN